jgi:hypothetical protein
MQATSGISQLDWEMEYQQQRRAGIEFYLRCIREGDVDGNHGGCCAECGRVNSLNIQKIRFTVRFFYFGQLMAKFECLNCSVTSRSQQARNFCLVLLSGHCRWWSSLGICRSQELGSGHSDEYAIFLSQRNLEERKRSLRNIPRMGDIQNTFRPSKSQ